MLFDGVFHAAHEVYGLTFAERPDLDGYHPDVRVFEVFDADGSGLGLFLADFYSRPTKRGGAWMNSLVLQSGLLGSRPVVVNNHNLAKPPAGEPTLLTFSQVDTLFHEFGHALHGLFSAVRYPYFSATAVPRDFVEFPSQVNEMWSLWPEVLGRYARHHETGEPMPADLVTRMKEAARFGQGFATVEYLAATLLDWAWHTLPAGADPGDPLAFEARALEAAGLDLPAIPPRYRTTYFFHVFASDYSAGYYSYIWSEVLDAETVDWFTANGGMSRAGGDLFRAAHPLQGRQRPPGRRPHRPPGPRPPGGPAPEPPRPHVADVAVAVGARARPGAVSPARGARTPGRPRRCPAPHPPAPYGRPARRRARRAR